MIKKSKTSSYILFATIFFVLYARESFAADAIAKIPGVNYSDLPSFVKTLYSWGIGIVGIMAFIQLVVGGIQYMISGAIDQKSAAKNRITDAFIGLALALASYLIVYTINPKLLTINFELKPIGVLLSGTEVTQCMTSTEIQTYADNNYSCRPAISKTTACQSGQGLFTCTPPAK